MTSNSKVANLPRAKLLNLILKHTSASVVKGAIMLGSRVLFVLTIEHMYMIHIYVLAYGSHVLWNAPKTPTSKSISSSSPQNKAPIFYLGAFPTFEGTDFWTALQ